MSYRSPQDRFLAMVAAIAFVGAALLGAAIVKFVEWVRAQRDRRRQERLTMEKQR